MTTLPIAPRLDSGLPAAVTTHKSGGRDQWTGPLAETPSDLLAATWAALNEVLDPEIPISLVELGLIYGLDLQDGIVRMRITFTATACPCMEFIREDITDRLEVESWIDRVEIEEVWSPPWTAEMITPEGRAKLKQFGVTA
ncbi:MAG: metal-sulfur cluster assembly factor [Gemmatimonadota bacterium]|nr:metal-sulfur cluster assembly factor [Gemmatimonadota bacterium]